METFDLRNRRLCRCWAMELVGHFRRSADIRLGRTEQKMFSQCKRADDENGKWQ
ncbi:MAG: hypothetical protein H9928_08960 [Candidatus Phocaeicola excrementipullorum]|uniref:Uncharacterized protein n=1 Tax=Candidatus Phocaeicola excrementipullorum TaxID=2838731 RepID=A0A948X1N5_9BACT|nr:hypothetical protein [Candidatus Phocaeicola excrementipullorum]